MEASIRECPGNSRDAQRSAIMCRAKKPSNTGRRPAADKPCWTKPLLEKLLWGLYDSFDLNHTGTPSSRSTARVIRDCRLECRHGCPVIVRVSVRLDLTPQFPASWIATSVDTCHDDYCFRKFTEIDTIWKSHQQCTARAAMNDLIDPGIFRDVIQRSS